MAPTGWLRLDCYFLTEEKLKNPNSTAAGLGRALTQTSQFRHLKTKGPLFGDSPAALLAASQVEPPELGAAWSIPAGRARAPRPPGPRASVPASAVSGTDSRDCRGRRAGARGPGLRGEFGAPRCGRARGRTQAPAAATPAPLPPTLTERPLSIRRGRRLSLPPSQAASDRCSNPATRRQRLAEVR